MGQQWKLPFRKSVCRATSAGKAKPMRTDYAVGAVVSNSNNLKLILDNLHHWKSIHKGNCKLLKCQKADVVYIISEVWNI